MSATAQELENEIAQMEDRLANVKVVVEVEKEAWRRSSRTGKRGTKWKGAAPPRNKDKDSAPPSTASANNTGSDDFDEAVTIMPEYWDALELAQYLKSKQLGSYAQVVVYEQITGKVLLDTPAPKLRKLFEDVDTSADDPSWKAFQNECVKLKKHQRRLEKAVATSRSMPDSARSLDASAEASDRRPFPSAVMSSAGAALVFPLISPRVPGPQSAKPPTGSNPPFQLRKPTSSNSIPMATCWNCKTRFFRPHVKRPAGGPASVDPTQPVVSSSMRASLVARAYCSKACQESIESSDIRISPSLSARVQVTFGSTTAPTEEKTKRTRPSRVATGLASMSSLTSDQPDPDPLSRGDGITTNRLGANANGDGSSVPPPRSKRLRKFKTFARRSSRPDASLDDPNNFDFLHVAAPRRETTAVSSASPRQEYAERANMVHGGRQAFDGANASGTFTMCPSATSLAINSYRTTGTSGDRSPNAKPVPPELMLSNSAQQAGLKQSKVYQQSRYKLDPDLFQTREETFSSCFGALPPSNRSYRLGGSRVVDYGRGNLLRLQEFLTVRALHRLSLTSRAWFELITVPSTFSDALWGVHVLRIWRPSEDDEEFLHDIGVLKKPERPRRMLQILTRQVSRVMVENMKVLLNPESWQLATVMTPQEGEGIRSLGKMVPRKRDRPVELVHQHRHPPPELYEQVTAIYTRAGEIVAVCARQLIRPVDPMALLTDILQGLKSGELSRVQCRRLRLFSQTNRLPFDQWGLLSHCSRSVVEFFWSGSSSETAVTPPLVLPVWHQKIFSKLQLALQQRLLGKDSINYVIKVAHDQSASAPVLLSLEKFLTRCHTHAVATSTSQQPRTAVESNATI
ncbi:hypothetical protein PHYSODRAFT_355348 [Phytophthora sojae]|uniref:Uncharacterized protein n=1 Tax=Phytophthora sojae (strain P6497) TaxID=1094619 RepID=G4ZZX4_PHYSP|nr:hypothetical protein PHYSODRAFT_355348 [Phytophthora sojae]EGZ11271.1 hypothetical protein PHYSODRAFT_355348 [Phytophthora sojae]|eukprot:XP_009534016.1 hypothetical protein PHYSODRAFT_355348 [Phytophthora sojae]